MRYGNPSKKTKVIASTKGHAVEFPGRGTIAKTEAPKGALVADDGTVFVPVPDPIVSEVAAQGMLPESELEEAEDVVKPLRPEDPEKLKAAAYKAFDQLVAGADRESFAGTGVPKGNAVEKVLGYALNNAEIKDLWGKYLIDKKDA